MTTRWSLPTIHPELGTQPALPRRLRRRRESFCQNPCPYSIGLEIISSAHCCQGPYSLVPNSSRQAEHGIQLVSGILYKPRVDLTSPSPLHFLQLHQASLTSSNTLNAFQHDLFHPHDHLSLVPLVLHQRCGRQNPSERSCERQPCENQRSEVLQLPRSSGP